MLAYLPDLVTGFLNAFVVNLRIGFLALCGGLILGAPLAFARSRNAGSISWTVSFAIGLLRAFPVFVLMFILFNLLPHPVGSHYFMGLPFAELVLILALCAYSVSVVSDATLDSIQFYRTGDSKQAWLLVPNLFRVFVILVMATSIGAAIGVQEAVTFTLRVSEQFYERTDKITLIALATVFFSVFFTLARAILDKVVDQFNRRRS